MSDHVVNLLGAYMDNELHGKQLQKVEAHLFECSFCKEEYAALRALSATLGEVPTPEFPSSERLANEVALRLPRKPVTPAHRKALEIGWWLVPVGLIATWIFISTTFIVSDIVSAANVFGFLNNTSDWLVAGSSSGATYSAFVGQFGVFEPDTLQWLTRSESFTRTIFVDVFWQVSIAMLYLSWIAIWWARHTRQGLGQPLEN